MFLPGEPEMLFTRKTECNKWFVTVKWINLVASPYCTNLPIWDWTLLWNCFAANHTLAPVRVRRQNTFRVVNFTACDRFNSLKKVQNCMDADWSLNCRMKDGTCYYYVSCKKINVRLEWECEQKHITYTIPACCEYICPWSSPRPYASIISYLHLIFSLFAYITFRRRVKVSRIVNLQTARLILKPVLNEFADNHRQTFFFEKITQTAVWDVLPIREIFLSLAFLGPVSRKSR